MFSVTAKDKFTIYNCYWLTNCFFHTLFDLYKCCFLGQICIPCTLYCNAKINKSIWRHKSALMWCIIGSIRDRKINISISGLDREHAERGLSALLSHVFWGSYFFIYSSFIAYKAVPLEMKTLGMLIWFSDRNL